MTDVLENVLLQDGELTLLSLENLPVEAIVSRAPADPGTESANGGDDGLYKHSFVLTLTGNYPATVRYFEALAELPWQFHWDGLRYQVQTYPEAIITLQVHTVSMSRDWIGV
jgi:MSHA biogenesis protein MshJ